MKSELEILQQRLKTLKKGNKPYKEGFAKKFGFSSAKEFKVWLEARIKTLSGQPVPNTPTVPPVQPQVAGKPVIHNVHILDVSGSMGEQNKLHFALEGINKEIEELKKETEVQYTQTVITFSDPGDYRVLYEKMPIDKAYIITARTKNMTALYDAIGKTLSKWKMNHNPAEKVLVKIFTDGQENKSREYNAKDIKNLIKEVEDIGFTVTFVGTEFDVQFVVSNLGVDLSNTLSHKNTAKSVADSFDVTMSSTRTYAKAVVKGEDVKKGFYKKRGGL